MFYIRELIWDTWNEDHIARHGVEPEEVEEAVRNDPYVTRQRNKTYGLICRTDDGRLLMVILAPQGGDIYFVVTARDANREERRLYARRRRTR